MGVSSVRLAMELSPANMSVHAGCAARPRRIARPVPCRPGGTCTVNTIDRNPMSTFDGRAPIYTPASLPSRYLTARPPTPGTRAPTPGNLTPGPEVPDPLRALTRDNRPRGPGPRHHPGSRYRPVTPTPGPRDTAPPPPGPETPHEPPPTPPRAPRGPHHGQRTSLPTRAPTRAPHGTRNHPPWPGPPGAPRYQVHTPTGIRAPTPAPRRTPQPPAPGPGPQDQHKPATRAVGARNQRHPYPHLHPRPPDRHRGTQPVSAGHPGTTTPGPDTRARHTSTAPPIPAHTRAPPHRTGHTMTRTPTTGHMPTSQGTYPHMPPYQGQCPRITTNQGKTDTPPQPGPMGQNGHKGQTRPMTHTHTKGTYPHRPGQTGANRTPLPLPLHNRTSPHGPRQNGRQRAKRTFPGN